MGRSRCGLASKIHSLIDAEGRLVMLRLTPGQVADCTQAEALIDGLCQGDILLADKGYDSDAIRAKAKERTPAPTSRSWQTVRRPSPSRDGSIASATSSSGSSPRQPLSRHRNKIRQGSHKLSRRSQARRSTQLVSGVVGLRPSRFSFQMCGLDEVEPN
jgi:transposase